MSRKRIGPWGPRDSEQDLADANRIANLRFCIQKRYGEELATDLRPLFLLSPEEVSARGWCTKLHHSRYWSTPLMNRGSIEPCLRLPFRALSWKDDHHAG